MTRIERMLLAFIAAAMDLVAFSYGVSYQLNTP